MDGFEVGDGVTTVEGPMSGVYGTVVWFYEEKEQILVRFGATQQMYFAAHELKGWGSRTTSAAANPLVTPCAPVNSGGRGV